MAPHSLGTARRPAREIEAASRPPRSPPALGAGRPSATPSKPAREVSTAPPSSAGDAAPLSAGCGGARGHTQR
eukprot:scaffold47789_cov63-Phaeocystis_antarctica.AAC.1